MIEQEHLEHWIGEIRYALNGIRTEIRESKVNTNGVTVNESFVSFEYLREKTETIEGITRCIEDDIRND